MSNLARSPEIKKGERFEFGKNWRRFLRTIQKEKIESAKNSLKEMLRVDNFEGMKFLDIGSGSGLFSLSARLLGAAVFSFDYDPEAMLCTKELKRRYFADDDKWRIEKGSALDKKFMSSLGKFDIVYAWGVLHHTGNMWEAIRNTISLVKPGGKIFISIYNDQGSISSYWKTVKKLYNSNFLFRQIIVIFHIPYLFVFRLLFRLLSGRMSLARGMSLWYDMKDWLGGYPFEVAKPEKIVELFHNEGFFLRKMKTCGGRHGCNEFVFEFRKNHVREKYP